MPYEQSPQPSLDEAYELNHWYLIDVMGQMQAELSKSYRNDQPRTSDLVGKQEEFKAMLLAALEFW